jgi:hypothetical protein
MSSFATRTFGDGVNPYFTLTNEEFVRKLEWDNGWNKIRIGILYAIQGSGNFSITRHGLGVCASASPIDDTQGMKSNSTANWIGGTLATEYYGAATAVYNTGPPPYYSIAAKGVASRRGSTIFNAGADGGTRYHPVAGQGFRGFMFTDIYKGSPNWTTSVYFPTSIAEARTEYSMSDLLEGVHQTRLNTLTLRGSVIAVAYNSGLMAFNESTGPVDSISLYWSNAAVPLEVYGIAVYATWQDLTN